MIPSLLQLACFVRGIAASGDPSSGDVAPPPASSMTEAVHCASCCLSLHTGACCSLHGCNVRTAGNADMLGIVDLCCSARQHAALRCKSIPRESAAGLTF